MPRPLASERDALLRWYDSHARDLPWRRTRDPYAVWVSEVMLQQTRVETVLGYFERFLARFPDLASLARASEDEVLAAWSGLGYYRRARLLHRGAQQIVARHGGRVPREPEARLALPGVGRYTAGAIGSIAFDLPEPAVDGNVARVLARLRGIETPLGAPQTEARLWKEAAALVEGPRPGALNQALMELGATVCTPSAPRCDACPVSSRCAARASDRAQVLPVRRARRIPDTIHLVALVARAPDGRVLMARGERSLYGGLWGVPMRPGRGAAAVHALLRESRIEARSFVARCRSRIAHTLTHRRLDVRVYCCDLVACQNPQARLVARTELASSLGVSRLVRRILDAAEAEPPAQR